MWTESDLDKIFVFGVRRSKYSKYCNENKTEYFNHHEFKHKVMYLK